MYLAQQVSTLNYFNLDIEHDEVGKKLRQRQTKKCVSQIYYVY